MRIQTHVSQCSRIVMRGQARTSAHIWTDIVHTASLYLSHIHIITHYCVTKPKMLIQTMKLQTVKCSLAQR